MNKVVVTGGAGFIGSHLAIKLEELGDSVIIVDKEDGGVENCEILDKAFKNATYVYHLGAEVGFGKEDTPWCYDMVNITGTCNVLRYALKHNVRGVVFASSASIYNPLSAYAISKIAGEQYCYMYSYKYGLPISVLRFYNVYGGGQNLAYGAAVPNFINALLRNEQPVIHGDGSQVRDFIYIDDVVKAMMTTIGHTTTLDIGSGKGISILKLFNIIALEMGKSVESFFDNEDCGVLHSVSPDDRFYETSMQSGLRRTIAYYERLL